MMRIIRWFFLSDVPEFCIVILCCAIVFAGFLCLDRIHNAQADEPPISWASTPTPEGRIENGITEHTHDVRDGAWICCEHGPTHWATNTPVPQPTDTPVPELADDTISWSTQPVADSTLAEWLIDNVSSVSFHVPNWCRIDHGNVGPCIWDNETEEWIHGRPVDCAYRIMDRIEALEAKVAALTERVSALEPVTLWSETPTPDLSTNVWVCDRCAECNHEVMHLATRTPVPTWAPPMTRIEPTPQIPCDKPYCSTTLRHWHRGAFIEIEVPEPSK
jgi:hypothetical protein